MGMGIRMGGYVYTCLDLHTQFKKLSITHIHTCTWSMRDSLSNPGWVRTIPITWGQVYLLSLITNKLEFDGQTEVEME